MKRRLKFVSSIMALTSAFAMLAYGVYAAAIQRNVGISGTITFTSTASRALVEVYKAEPYGEYDMPAFLGLADFSHSLSTESGSDANKGVNLETIALNDTTPNFSIKIIVKSLETNKYVDLSIDVNPISSANDGVVKILLNLEEETEFYGSLKPEETREFILEYHVDSYLASEIEENFGANVTISQGEAYTPINQNSAGVTQGLDIDLNADGETAIIKGISNETLFNQSNGDVVFPDYYFTDGVNHPITVIGDDAFFNYDIEETINHIQLPMYLEEIGAYAFYSKEISNVQLPMHLETIGGSAFYGNALTSIIIPSSVITIGGYAFGGNWSLIAVLLQEGLITIEEAAFQGPISRLSIPNSVTTIGAFAFYDIDLVSIKIPKNVVNIGNYFAGDSLLRIKVDEDNQNYKSIDNVLFSKDGKTLIYSAQKTSYIIPYGVESIGNAAFYRNQLTSVTIPDSVTTIGVSAFYSNQLTSVTIPDSVTTIGDSAFSNNQLTSIIIPDSVTTIGNYAFSYNQLTSVTIPDSVTTIGDSAFYSNQLTSITIPSSVTSIGYMAFSHNNSLTTVYIDSADINVFASQNSQGYLIYAAETVYFKEGITPSGSYLTRNFVKQQTSNQAGYSQYNIIKT